MKKSILGLIFFVVAACQVVRTEVFSVTSLADVPAVRLPVKTVEVVSEAQQHRSLPYIDYRIPVRPETALKEALANHYKAVDAQSENTVRFVIKNISLIQEYKKSNHWYVLDNVEYILSYDLDVVYAPNTAMQEIQSLSGWEQQAIPQKSSLATKEKIWQKMINAMIIKVTDKITADIPPAFK